MEPLAESIDLGGGRRAAYEVVGKGEPLLYLVGGPGFSAAPLRENAALLGDRFACHLVDPHGSGGSTAPRDDSEYDHVGHAEFYDRVRKALGLERVSVAGESFGAIVALTYAALFPETTERCITLAGRGVGEELEGEDAEAEMERALQRHAHQPWYPEARRIWDGWTDRVLAATDSSEVDAMMGVVMPLYFADPDDPRSAEAIARWRDGTKTDLRAVKVWENGLYQRIDVRPLLSHISCPTLIVAGEHDLLCGPAHAYALANEILDADVAIIPGAGHFIADENPEDFRDAILAWVDDRTDRPLK